MSNNKKSYELIYDSNQVEQFQKLFCTTVDTYHGYILYLAARRKYDGRQKHNTSTCFNRQIISPHLCGNLVQYIQRYEVPYGVYTNLDGTIVEQNALVVYFCLNPRNMLKGFNAMCKKINDKTEMILFSETKQDFSNLIGDLKSCIHSAPSMKLYFELDIDTKDKNIVKDIVSVVSKVKKHIVCTIETRGGYHVIFNNLSVPKDEKSELWKTFSQPNFMFTSTDFNGLKITKKYVDVRSDASPPVPGTLQGGFRVKFVELENIIN